MQNDQNMNLHSEQKVFREGHTIPYKNPTVRQHSCSAYPRALCHTAKHTCCLATNKTQAHYHAATTVVYMAQTHGQRTSLSQTHTHTC